MEVKKTVLSVKNLSVSFTQYERWIQRTTLLAVKDVSLTVKEGELVAVVGSSGSGKSLLLMECWESCLIMLPGQGRYLIMGKSLRKNGWKGFGERRSFWFPKAFPIWIL